MIIFGQQDYAERLQNYFDIISPRDEIKVFSFPITMQNPAEYSFDFSRYDEELSNTEKEEKIIASFGDKCQEDAVEHLKSLGFSNIRLFDADMDNNLKKEFFKRKFNSEHKEFSLIDEEKSVVVYMAKSASDQSLKNYPTNLSKYITPIQVGAALTDKKIADVTDNTGENISERNRHFSEATALYWMWKNANADYLGLCHYRRLWKNLDVIAEKLQNDSIDVVLPLPTLMQPSALEGHLKHYTPEVWETTLKVLKRRSPEYYVASKRIFDGNIFYASNMLIAKRHVLDKLCAWMFPIVMEIEELTGELENTYYNRYCGFCTEQLITLYFLYNKEKHVVTHAEKIFIE